MSSSDNLISMEPRWDFRPTFADSWLTEALARDTETLTKALQKSLSSDQSDVVSGGEIINPFYQSETTPGHTPTVSGGSEAETAASKRRSGVGVSTGKITKRKSRASKRPTTTTFINANPANFRQMVQQVTGVRFGGNGLLPDAAAVLKPEPQRLASRFQSGCFLPTLDTSAFLLEPTNQTPPQQNGVHHHVGPALTMAVQSQASSGSIAPTQPVVAGGVSAGFDFESLFNFPKLESWN